MGERMGFDLVGKIFPFQSHCKLMLYLAMKDQFKW